MSRKKNSQDGVVLLVIVAIALITPIVIIGGYFFNKDKFSKIKDRLNGNKYDFWLTPEEKDGFQRSAKEYVHVRNIIDEANQKGIDKNISKNKNGTFSSRSSLGKEIQDILKIYTPKMHLFKNEVVYFTNLPRNRWLEFNTYVQRTYAFLWAFVGWASMFVFLQIFKDYNLNNQLFELSFISAIVAIICYAVTINTTNNIAEKYTPIPDEVDFSNIDLDKEEKSVKIDYSNEHKFLSTTFNWVLASFIIYNSYSYFFKKIDKNDSQSSQEQTVSDSNTNYAKAFEQANNRNKGPEDNLSKFVESSNNDSFAPIVSKDQEDFAVNAVTKTSLYKDLVTKYPNTILFVEDQDSNYVYLYLGFDEKTHTTRYAFARVSSHGVVQYTTTPPENDNDWIVIKSETLQKTELPKSHNQEIVVLNSEDDSDVVEVLIQGNSEKCKASIDSTGELIETTCKRLTNSKNIELLCTEKKSVCKTIKEVANAVIL